MHSYIAFHLSSNLGWQCAIWVTEKSQYRFPTDLWWRRPKTSCSHMCFKLRKCASTKCMAQSCLNYLDSTELTFRWGQVKKKQPNVILQVDSKKKNCFPATWRMLLSSWMETPGFTVFLITENFNKCMRSLNGSAGPPVNKPASRRSSTLILVRYISVKVSSHPRTSPGFEEMKQTPDQEGNRAEFFNQESLPALPLPLLTSPPPSLALVPPPPSISSSVSQIHWAWSRGSKCG